MNFGQKLKLLRKQANMSQAELAKCLGVTERSIHNYESNARYPKGQEVLRKIAKTFDVTTDYLLQDTSNIAEESQTHPEQQFFLEVAGEKYGAKGRHEAVELLKRTGAMFAGGELTEADKDAFFQSITQAYFEAKQAARAKYGLK